MNKEMEVDLIYYELKLQSLLEKFLENGYHIKNDVYFNRLLSFLAGKESQELAEVLLKLPLMSEWIIRAVKLWEDNRTIPDHSISAFTLQLLGLISKNEHTFTNLSKFNIYNRAIHILDVRNVKSLPSIKLGFIKLLMSLLKHSPGREWLIQTTYWQDVLILSLQSQTVYITRDGSNFISSFLLTMLQHNVTFCSRVWQIIIKPILTKPTDRFRNQGQHFEVNDEEIINDLAPTVALVNNILEFFFDKSIEMNADVKKFRDISLMKPIIQSINNYLLVVRNPFFTFELGRIWILLLFFSMTMDVNDDGTVKAHIDRDFMQPVHTFLGILLDGGKNLVILRTCYYILVHWFKLTAKINVEYSIEGNTKLSFEEQFVILQLNPILRFWQSTCNVEEGSEFKEAYYEKVFSKLSRNSVRFGYRMWHSLGPEDMPTDLGPRIMTNILRMKGQLSRESAVLIFQSLLFTFYDTNVILMQNPHLVPIFARYEDFLRALLEAIGEFIVHFNFSWKDTVESICVIQSSVEFLKIPVWPAKLVIANLNLIKVGISKYLSPELALIVDDEKSAISTLGPLLKAKLHDPEWSVRDSALEVISKIAEVSYIEFQSFQKVILDSDLCNLVLQVSHYDGESFVRASAIKCLNQLVQIELFWKQHMDGNDIIKKMSTVLKCETEGIVRAEAAKILGTIFKKYDVNPSVSAEIYNSMNWAATEDLHWEVRLGSLSFWNDRIERKLTDQGMVDGEFPDCTFSLESRKIVSLTDAEIKKRLLRVLDELSDIGCLTVLKHAMADDCDLQVSKKGLEISRTLVDLIEKYKLVENVNMEETGPPSNDSCYFSLTTSSPSPGSKVPISDDVIDQIVEASDTLLLKDVYHPGVDYTSVNVRTPRHIVTTKEFVVLTQKNFKSLVDEREKWINSLDSLSSLLNDMLESYELTDTNTMDCY